MEGKVPAVMGEITGPEPEVGLTQRTRPERPTLNRLFSSSSAGLLLLKLDMQVHSFIHFLFIFFIHLFLFIIFLKYKN